MRKEKTKEVNVCEREEGKKKEEINLVHCSALFCRTDNG